MKRGAHLQDVEKSAKIITRAEEEAATRFFGVYRSCSCRHPPPPWLCGTYYSNRQQELTRSAGRQVCAPSDPDCAFDWQGWYGRPSWAGSLTWGFAAEYLGQPLSAFRASRAGLR